MGQKVVLSRGYIFSDTLHIFACYVSNSNIKIHDPFISIEWELEITLQAIIIIFFLKNLFFNLYDSIVFSLNLKKPSAKENAIAFKAIGSLRAKFGKLFHNVCVYSASLEHREKGLRM